MNIGYFWPRGIVTCSEATDLLANNNNNSTIKTELEPTSIWCSPWSTTILNVKCELSSLIQQQTYKIGSTVSPWLRAYLSVLSTDYQDLLLMLKNDDNS